MNAFQIIFVAIILAVTAVVAFMMIQYDHKRKQQYRELAEQLGFTTLKQIPGEVLQRIKRTYQTSTQVKASTVAQKQINGREVYLMDVSYANMRAENGEVEYRVVCMLHERLNLPFFLMLYQFEEVYGAAGSKINKLMKIAIPLLGMKKISFNHPAFEKKYQVYGFKEEEIKRVFTARLLMDLSGTEQWLVRAEGDCVCFNTYVVQKGGELTMEQMHHQLDSAQTLLQWLTE